MANATENNQLRKLANAIQELANTVNSENPHIKISQLVHACRFFATLKFNFGFPFVFVDLEVSSKVDYVERGATSEDETLQSLVERDIAQGIAKVNSSPSRNAIRLKRTIEMVMVVSEQMLENEGSDSLVDPITIAYGQVFAPYHGPVVREAFSVAKAFIPTFSSVLNVLNEDENSVKEPLQKYVAASKVVVQYMENVYQSYESSAELLGLI
ncbi:hypothetical protein TIFTF001_038071 [Ficus carica]|uniref:Glycolipid transfer protein domain-containing protein n=1 Tax=Ficus carica TaxID=3494 RepID=A0AA88JCQ9_FICCA|nr:hypothetical protein TIFTF001_038071 [Ficus carica]